MTKRKPTKRRPQCRIIRVWREPDGSYASVDEDGESGTVYTGESAAILDVLLKYRRTSHGKK